MGIYKISARLRSLLVPLIILIIIISSLNSYVASSSYASTRVQGALEAPSESATTSFANRSFEFIDIILPVSALSRIIGLGIDQLIIGSCYDNYSLSLPKMIPRKISATHLANTNETILLPDLGEGVLREDDFIIASVYIPRDPQEISNCSWHPFAAKNGLRERYVVTLLPGVGVVKDRSLTPLSKKISVVIYFDREKKIPVKGVYFDTDLLERIGSALGIETPKFTDKITSREETIANNWLSNLKQRLKQMSIIDKINVVHEQREAFLYDPSRDKLIKEIKELPKSDQQVFVDKVREIYPNAELIGDSGGPLRYYDFTFIIVNFTKLNTSIRRDIYLGYNVIGSAIYVRANSSSSIATSLRISINVVDTDSKALIWSYSNTYDLNASLRDIYIFPSIPFDSTRRFNVSIEFSPNSYTPPYILVSTIKILKTWDNMPTNQTSKGLQILSVGIASLRQSGSPPYPCSRAKASDLLDPSVYPASPAAAVKQGLYVDSGTGSVTIDSKLMNGLYYDSLYSTSPILYIDICIENLDSSSSYSGTVSIKIDGVQTQSKSVYVSGSYSYAGFTILLNSNNIEGFGHIITIEYNLPPQKARLYIDILIEYLYAPETWRETSYATWTSPDYGVAWFKLQIHQSVSAAVLWESSLAIEARAIKNSPRDQVMVIKNLVSAEKGSYVSVGNIVVAAKPPTNAPPPPPSCGVTFSEGVNYDRYIGLAVTVLNIIITGIEIAKYILPISSVVSAGVEVMNLMNVVLRGAMVSLTVSKYNDYYVCSWSPGINKYKVVVVSLLLPYPPGYEANFVGSSFDVYVYISNNDLWLIKPVKVSIPVYTSDQVANSVIEPYSMFYGKPPSEAMYD